jgi:hypothetical protein
MTHCHTLNVGGPLGSSYHIFFSVLALSLYVCAAGALSTHVCRVDLCVCVHLPLLIHTMLNDLEWPFGRVMCKLYMIGENLPKLTSTYLLALMSCERYMAVCQPLLFSRWAFMAHTPLHNECVDTARRRWLRRYCCVFSCLPLVYSFPYRSWPT